MLEGVPVGKVLRGRAGTQGEAMTGVEVDPEDVEKLGSAAGLEIVGFGASVDSGGMGTLGSRSGWCWEMRLNGGEFA